MRDRRADRVLGDVALQPLVGRAAALARHHVRGLPGADDRLAHAPHGLRVAADDRDRAEVVQDVLGGDRRAADARLGEREVLRDLRVQVVADDQHVEVLVDGVDRVRARRVRRARDDVGLRRDGDDVRRVPAARALRVVRVDRCGRRSRRASTARSRPRSSVSVWIAACTPVSAAIRRQVSIAAGVVPQSSCSLKPPTPASACSRSPASLTGVALAQQQHVDRVLVEREQHLADRPRRRRAGRRARALGGPGAAADQRRHPRGDRLVDDLRADEVHVRVDPARGQDAALAGDDLGRRADLQLRVDAVHHVRVARFAQGRRSGRT